MGLGALVRQIRIGNRITLGIAPVCLALLLFAGLILRGQFQDVSRSDVLIGLSDLAVQTNALVHEMQKERGSSALFLGSKGTQFGPQLADQRKASDQRVSGLETSLRNVDESVKAAIGAELLTRIDEMIKQLPALRTKVDRQEIPAKDVVGAYTAAIRHLITLVVQVGTAAPDVQAAKLITSYVTLSEAKEAAGQERATGSAGFAAGKFETDLYKRYIELGSAQKTALSLFERYATPAALGNLKQILTAEVEDPVIALRKVVVDSAFTGHTGGVAAPAWFATSTKRIDALKAVEDSVAEDIKRHATSMRDRAQQSVMLVSTGLVILLVLTVILLLVVVRSIVRPVRTLASVMTRLAGGDLQVRLDEDHSQDEVGEMARATLIFKTKSEEQRRLEQQQAEQEHQAALDRQRMLNELADHFERTVKAKVEEVGRSSDKIRDTAHVMAKRSEHSGGHSLHVGEASEATTQRSAVVSAATHEMSLSVNEIAQQVGHSSQIAQRAVSEVNDTADRMSGLSDAVSAIGAVVKLISDIAKQTNLLALNATIEAARAGDAGKGFAVVANEVKTLATQTSRAADDIIRQVSAVQDSTSAMTGSISDVMDTIRSLEEVSSAIASAVQEQEATTREIASNIASVADESAQVFNTVADLAQSSVLTSAGTIRVIWSARTLSKVVAALEEETVEFLRKVRA